MRHLLIIFIFLCFQKGIGQYYDVRSYSLSDGLPQSQVFDIKNDPWGNLWMSTRGGGLSKFDGRKFINYTTNKGLVNDYVNGIHVSSDSLIIVTTDDGLSVYNGVSFKSVRISSTKQVKINDVAQLGEEYWLATEIGLYYTSDWKNFKEFESGRITNNPVYEIEKIGSSIWAGALEGLYEIQNKEVVFSSFKVKDINVLIQKDSILYGSSQNQGIFELNDTELKFLSDNSPLKNQIVHALVFKEDQLLAGTMQSGVWVYNDSWKPFLNQVNGLSNNHVRSLQVDNWGDLWVGTSGGGVNHYRGERFKREDHRLVLENSYIYSMEKSDSLFVVSNADLQVKVLYKDTLVTLGENQGISSKSKTLAIHPNGDLYIGTDQQGLFIYNQDTLVHLDYESGLISSIIYDIEFQGDLTWIATDMGIQVFSSKTNQKFTVQNGLLRNRTNELKIGENGRVWLTTRGNGLAYIENNEVTYVDGIEGDVRAISYDSRGYVWAASGSEGVYKVNSRLKKVEEKIDSSAYLISKNIYSIEIDDLGNLWVGSDKGITQWQLSKEGEILEVVHFGESDGIEGIETNLRAIKSFKNEIFIGTVDGLYSSDIAEISQASEISNVYWNSIQLSYEDLFKNPDISLRKWYDLDEIDLSYNENNLFFDFSAVNLHKPQSIQYSWQLVHWDNLASPFSERHTAIYNNLPPGDYEFLVYAKNERSGVLKQKSLRIKIDAPIWKKIWFLIALGSGIILLLAIFVWRRLKRIKFEAKMIQDKLVMKNELLELEQKALQLQMNPHFIFNVLNSIQSLISIESYDKSRLCLTKFAKLMRQILNHSREDWVLLSDEMEMIENYVLLEDFIGERNVTLKIEVDQEIIDEGIQVMPMIIQPFVENALIHAFKGKDSGSIVIQLKEEGDQLFCYVRDNGIGLSKGEELKSKSHKSQGLDVTTDRLRNYFNLEEVIFFNEIKNEDQVEGTEVKILLPFKF